MSSQVSHFTASEQLTAKEAPVERTSADPRVSPGWSEYFKFLGAVGLVGTSVFLAPVLGIVAISSVVTMFGWLFGDLPF